MHRSTSESLVCDFVLLELLTLVASRNTTPTNNIIILFRNKITQAGKESLSTAVCLRYINIYDIQDMTIKIQQNIYDAPLIVTSSLSHIIVEP